MLLHKKIKRQRLYETLESDLGTNISLCTCICSNIACLGILGTKTALCCLTCFNTASAPPPISAQQNHWELQTYQILHVFGIWQKNITLCLFTALCQLWNITYSVVLFCFFCIVIGSESTWNQWVSWPVWRLSLEQWLYKLRLHLHSRCPDLCRHFWPRRFHCFNDYGE